MIEEMTRLSVNINKIATIRNARGGRMPDVAKAAVDCERFGAEGITVHPRPDERHIRYSDVREIKPLVTTEFNIEGNPITSFMDLVIETLPHQVTLVPDAENAITSNAGWDTISNRSFLTEVCAEFRKHGIRTSIFVGADPAMVEGAAVCPLACGDDGIAQNHARWAANCQIFLTDHRFYGIVCPQNAGARRQMSACRKSADEYVIGVYVIFVCMLAHVFDGKRRLLQGGKILCALTR